MVKDVTTKFHKHKTHLGGRGMLEFVCVCVCNVSYRNLFWEGRNSIVRC